MGWWSEPAFAQTWPASCPPLPDACHWRASAAAAPDPSPSPEAGTADPGRIPRDVNLAVGISSAVSPSIQRCATGNQRSVGGVIPWRSWPMIPISKPQTSPRHGSTRHHWPVFRGLNICLRPRALEPEPQASLQDYRRTSEPGITPWITAAIVCRRASIGNATGVFMHCILIPSACRCSVRRCRLGRQGRSRSG